MRYTGVCIISRGHYIEVLLYTQEILSFFHINHFISAADCVTPKSKASNASLSENKNQDTPGKRGRGRPSLVQNDIHKHNTDSNTENKSQDTPGKRGRGRPSLGQSNTPKHNTGTPQKLKGRPDVGTPSKDTPKSFGKQKNAPGKNKTLNYNWEGCNSGN